jgi:branched-chain amino acid transport system permease protein
MSSSVRRVAVVAVIAAIAIGLAFALSGYDVSNLSNAVIYAIAILGISILTGYNGQISLGHGAFLAVGAFVAAIATTRFNLNWALTLPLAAIVCGLLGFAIGVPALRLEGIYLALATFALGVAAPIVLLKPAALTGGVRGIIETPITSPTDALSDDQFFYFCCLAVAALLYLVAWNLLRGRTGRAFRAIRDAELAARAFGVDLPAYKTMAFALSAAYAGVAGALYGLSQGFVSADQFTFLISISLLIGAIVGGLGTLEGALVGGLFVWYLPILAQGWLQPVSKQLATAAPQVTQGVVLVIVMFFARDGVAGLVRRGYRELKGRLGEGGTTGSPADGAAIQT